MATEVTTPDRPLYPQQRQDAILRLAREQGRVEVASLSERFDVTTETVRRDLTDLQRRRLLRRVHGGAIPWGDDGFEPLLARRETRHTDEKRRIAAAAARELPPEGTVLLDSGSTTAMVPTHLPTDAQLTLVTNSVVAAQLLDDHHAVEVVVLGGRFDKRTLAMVDEQTIAAVAELTVDTLVLGTDGISPDGGLTTPYRNQAALKQAMIASARHVMLVADSSKAGQDHFIRFAGCNEVDTLITDTGLDDDTCARLEATGLAVLRV